jgi:hypothetical protein
MLYDVASKPKPLDKVRRNLIPTSLTRRREYIRQSFLTNKLGCFLAAEFVPQVYDIPSWVSNPETEKVITLHFMEYNGSWKKPAMHLLLKPGPRPSTVYITDLGPHESNFHAIGLGRAEVGAPAFIVTDAVMNLPVLLHFDNVKAGDAYVLHAATKMVHFKYIDLEGIMRELLNPVVYGEPPRMWTDRVRAGLGISEWASMTFLRHGQPFPPDYKNFNFSDNIDELDWVIVRTDVWSEHRMLYHEHPVERIPEWTLVCPVIPFVAAI